MKRHQFRTQIRAGQRGGAFVEIPEAARSSLDAKGRCKVEVTFDGVPYRGSAMSMNGSYIVGVRKEIRSAIGKNVGDVVTVSIRRDDKERVVDLPVELSIELESHPAAKRRFDAMSYTHRREYATWVGEAKKPETRTRRARQAIEQLRKG